MLELGRGEAHNYGDAQAQQTEPKHAGYVPRVAALVCLTAAVAGMADTFSVAWPWAVLAGVVGGVAAGLYDRMNGHGTAASTFWGTCWVLAGAWIARVCAHALWGRGVSGIWTSWVVGGGLLIMLALIFTRVDERYERLKRQRLVMAQRRAAEEAAAEAWRAASTPEAVAAREELEATAAWTERIYRCCDGKLRVEIYGIVPWEGASAGYGYDVYGSLPGGGSTLSQLMNAQEALAVDAALRERCFGVQVHPGRDRAEFILKVSTSDAMAEPRNFPLERLTARTIADPISLGREPDGFEPGLFLRSDTLLLAGAKGSGKSNMMHVCIAGLCQCTDTINFVIDLSKQGALGSLWVRPYVFGQATRPGVEWPAATWDEARRMTEFCLHLLAQRQRHYQKVMLDANDDKLPVCPGRPKIMIWVDEVAEIFGTDVRPEDPMVPRNLATIIRVGRQMAIDVVLCGLRVTSDVIPQTLTTQAGAKIGMRADDENELAQLFGWRRGLSNDDIPHEGCGFWQQRTPRPRPFRGWRLEPQAIGYVVQATAQYRSQLDLGIVDKIYREDFEGRWERMVPVMFPGMEDLVVVGRQPVLPAQVSTPRQDTGPDTSAPGGQDSRPAEGGHPAPVSPHPDRTPASWEVLGQPQASGDAAGELAAAFAALQSVREDLEVGSETGAAGNDTGEPYLRLVSSVEEDPDELEEAAHPERVSDRERVKRAQALILEWLRLAGPAGLSIEVITEKLAGAGIEASSATIYRWVREVAPTPEWGVWTHPDWRRSG